MPRLLQLAIYAPRGAGSAWPATNATIGTPDCGRDESHRDASSTTPTSSSHHGHWTMIVAMSIMRMMQMTIDQVVKMIPMRYSFVPAVWAMDMIAGVANTALSALLGVSLIDWQHVFGDGTVRSGAVQMTVV